MDEKSELEAAWWVIRLVLYVVVLPFFVMVLWNGLLPDLSKGQIPPVCYFQSFMGCLLLRLVGVSSFAK